MYKRQILTSEIVKGDTILVQAGDKVPTDGVLFEGPIKVSQAALNGEVLVGENLLAAPVLEQDVYKRQDLGREVKL